MLVRRAPTAPLASTTPVDVPVAAPWPGACPKSPTTSPTVSVSLSSSCAQEVWVGWGGYTYKLIEVSGGEGGGGGCCTYTAVSAGHRRKLRRGLDVVAVLGLVKRSKQFTDGLDRHPNFQISPAHKGHPKVSVGADLHGPVTLVCSVAIVSTAASTTCGAGATPTTSTTTGARIITKATTPSTPDPAPAPAPARVPAACTCATWALKESTSGRSTHTSPAPHHHFFVAATGAVVTVLLGAMVCIPPGGSVPTTGGQTTRTSKTAETARSGACGLLGQRRDTWPGARGAIAAKDWHRQLRAAAVRGNGRRRQGWGCHDAATANSWLGNVGRVRCRCSGRGR